MSDNNLIYKSDVTNRKEKKYSFNIWRGSHYIDTPSGDTNFSDTFIFNVGVSGVMSNIQKVSGKAKGTVNIGISFKRMVGNGNFFSVAPSQWEIYYDSKPTLTSSNTNKLSLNITESGTASYLGLSLQSDDWKVGVYELPITITWKIDRQYSLSHKIRITVETLQDNTSFNKITIDNYDGIGSEQENKGTLTLTFNNTTDIKNVVCQLKGDIDTKQYVIGDVTTTNKVKSISVNSGSYSIKLYSDSNV